MRFKLVLAALLVATGAFAEEASVSPDIPVHGQASEAPKKFYLEIDQNDLNALSAAIMELPKKIADPLALKLNGQLSAQQPIQEGAEKAEKARKRK